MQTQPIPLCPYFPRAPYSPGSGHLGYQAVFPSHKYPRDSKGGSVRLWSGLRRYCVPFPCTCFSLPPVGVRFEVFETWPVFVFITVFWSRAKSTQSDVVVDRAFIAALVRAIEAFVLDCIAARNWLCICC